MARAMTGVATNATPIAMSTENGLTAAPSNPANASNDSTEASPTDTSPTGFQSCSMPRRNSGKRGEMCSTRLLITISVAIVTSHAMTTFA
ncbi:hypothetical protein [Paractinoplanes durhamensis]|uniref:hypothetical protein n=1 Tax=Paractinoplanes durhamensis TaxID=113563 RepID=UPI00363C1C88